MSVAQNLGAQSPSYDGEIVQRGQTGGIMDYGMRLSTGTHVAHISTLILSRSHRRHRVCGSNSVRQVQPLAHLPCATGSFPVLGWMVLFMFGHGSGTSWRRTDYDAAGSVRLVCETTECHSWWRYHVLTINNAFCDLCLDVAFLIKLSVIVIAEPLFTLCWE